MGRCPILEMVRFIPVKLSNNWTLRNSYYKFQVQFVFTFRCFKRHLNVIFLLHFLDVNLTKPVVPIGICMLESMDLVPENKDYRLLHPVFIVVFPFIKPNFLLFPFVVSFQWRSLTICTFNLPSGGIFHW